jgi:cytochrome c5
MNINLRVLTAFTLLALPLGLTLNGCSTAPSGAAGKPASVAGATDIHAKSGAQLWGERCGFCHNVRSPTSFNDAQWEVATLHMRVRANLTGEEQRKILEFLKSAD